MFYSICTKFFVIFYLCCAPLYVLAKEQPAKVISGWVEKLTLQTPGITTKAKLDTGAKTSSINAKNIELFKKKGKRWVRFELEVEALDDKMVRVPMEKRRVRRVRIKDHDGDFDKRVVVELNICFDGRPYTTDFTLVDRSEFIYDILLGREFLADIAVVDSKKTFQTVAGCLY